MSPSRCALTSMRIIRIIGRDARAFLHGQLTQDLLSLDAGQGAVAAWLDAKGRVRAFFEIARGGDKDEETWLLVTAADRADAVRAQLNRYVLRADVSLEAADESTVQALLGPSTRWLAQQGVDLDASPYAQCGAHGAVWLRLGPELVHAVGPRTALEPLLAPLAQATREEAARAEIALGLPLIGAALSERYVPQMLSLDALGAVSFDKGCYPGQEIVARTHNLGTVKRRLARLWIAGAVTPEPGAAVSDGAGQPAGEVVRAARAGEGVELLAVVRVDALADALQVAGDDGSQPAERLALPFDTPAEP